jgi:hypothetical protein
VDTTDTHTFAEYNSANRGKFGITFAYRIGNNTEQKRAAGFLLVPFEPPAERPPTVSAGAEDAMELAVDSGNWLEFSRTNEMREEHRRRVLGE